MTYLFKVRFKSHGNVLPAGTVLTLEAWLEYRSAQSRHKNSDYDEYDKRKFKKEFLRIESCEEITRNFFTVSDESRQGIVRLVEFGFSHAEIIAYTNIFHRMKRLHPKVEAHKLLFTTYEGHKGYSPEISSEFVDASYKFVNFQKRTSNRTIWTWGKASRTPLYLLSHIYGEQKIIDAIDLWVENLSANDHLDDFIGLLEQFDDLDDDYPLSWMLGVLTSDICTKLQMVDREGVKL